MEGKGFDAVRMKRENQARKLDEAAGRSPEQRASDMAQRLADGPFADIWRSTHPRPAVDRQPERRAAA